MDQPERRVSSPVRGVCVARRGFDRPVGGDVEE